MKRIIMTVLLASASLMAAEGVKADTKVTIDGAKLYKQRCSICHGVAGKKVPDKAVGPLAGRDATELALKIRSYRDQDRDVGSYTMKKDSRVMKDATNNLSREQIVALAKYINSLK